MLDPTLTFGKHRGRALRDVPTGYLRWLLSGCDNITQWLREEVREELRRRGSRFLPADLVLADLENLIAEAVDADWRIDHAEAALLSDCVLVAFEQLRQQYEIGAETELTVPARPLARRTEGRLCG
jgi:hypothetical protein